MNLKVKDSILIGIFAALTAIGAFIKIPVPPVPFTLQIFFVILSGLLLGSKKAFLAQIIYIAIGLLGLPIFSSGGGIQYIFNPTFGYLIGFSLCAFVVGYIAERSKRISFLLCMVASLIGLLISYLMGVSYLYVMMKYVLHIEATISGTIVKGFLLFLPADIVKIILASYVANQVLRYIDIK